MAKPVLVLVDDEDAGRYALARELESRYGVHYRIVSSSSPRRRWPGSAEFRAQGVTVPLVPGRPLDAGDDGDRVPGAGEGHRAHGPARAADLMG